MSVKFEKDTIKQTAGAIPAGPVGPESLGQTLKEAGQTLRDGKHDGKHDLMHNVGVVVTGGKQNEGTKGYLAVR